MESDPQSEPARVAAAFSPSEPQQRALGAYVALMRAANAVTRRVHGPLGAFDLTLGQFGVLEALTHVGPLRQHELAEKVLSSAGNLSIVLDNLEKRRLVRRSADPADARCTVVAATAKGRRLMDEIFPPHAARLTAEFAALSPAEQDELRRLCRKLGLAGV